MLNRYPLAIVSLVVGIISFVQLLGLEKALLAVVLGWVAVKRATPDQAAGKKYAYAGIVLGALYVVVVVTVMILRGPEIMNYIRGMR